MDNTKEKSAVGMSVPATDTEINRKTSISHFDEKIKSKILESICQHDDIVGFRPVTDNSIEVEYRDGTKDWYVGINGANSIHNIYASIKNYIY